ncbi:calcium-binding protein [Sphaerisporangium siamense]|uniref:Ca2+-binding EF-hand superfamily protein n=1 Tax=Sphaerisporangium siamense TaxID=795645 RepID=A0A7W7DDL2_9ACTN|nr:EF-hand domain-containing protein [Sphaerisporangium siamense]MBB4703716.1 Ca2+-binding EF-hand superfamily protein [Sphaerisporangium siamense]GII82187.1 calcium-binding protein [Sphaerisporangium siamense]
MSASLTETNLAAVFAALDADGDGHLGVHDFKTLADRMCARLAPDPASARHRAVQAACAGWWEQIRESADADGDGRVSEAEYVAAADAHTGSGPGHLRVVLALCDVLFDIADADEDGSITREEFAGFYTASRLDPRLGESGFDGLDADGDGKITKEEFTSGIRTLLTSEDTTAPGTWLLGVTSA